MVNADDDTFLESQLPMTAQAQELGDVTAGEPSGNAARLGRLGQIEDPPSQGALLWRRLKRDKFALAGLVIILFTIFLAIAAPLVAPYDPYAQNVRERLQPIGSPGHLLGTDGNGRDILSRLIYGSRTALVAATLPVMIAGIIGMAMGLVAGYFGGWIDSLLMRIADVLFAFPAILLAIAIVAALGPSLVNAMVALAIVFIPAFARLVRSLVLTLRERDYVQAAKASGATSSSVLTRHILANALSPIIVFATLQTGQMIIFAAALSFLGLGVPPGTPDWGKMANDGRDSMLIAPWVTTLPGMAILFLSMGFNLLGDGLRDALDPTLKT
jgi:peptide/nickel transport system permease protein